MTGIEHFCLAVIGAELGAIAVKKNPKTILKNFFRKNFGRLQDGRRGRELRST